VWSEDGETRKRKIAESESRQRERKRREGGGEREREDPFEEARDEKKPPIHPRNARPLTNTLPGTKISTALNRRAFLFLDAAETPEWVEEGGGRARTGVRGGGERTGGGEGGHEPRRR